MHKPDFFIIVYTYQLIVDFIHDFLDCTKSKFTRLLCVLMSTSNTVFFCTSKCETERRFPLSLWVLRKVNRVLPLHPRLKFPPPGFFCGQTGILALSIIGFVSNGFLVYLFCISVSLSSCYGLLILRCLR